MSSLEEDWEEYLKTEAQSRKKLFDELEQTLSEQEHLRNFINDWASVIGIENIEQIYIERNKKWVFYQV